MGGLTSAIYNEVLQFFLIVFGFLPLVLLGLKDVGGWDGLVAKLVKPSHQRGIRPRHLDPFVVPHRLGRDQSHGSGMVRSGHGAGIRALLRLLVH